MKEQFLREASVVVITFLIIGAGCFFAKIFDLGLLGKLILAVFGGITIMAANYIIVIKNITS